MSLSLNPKHLKRYQAILGLFWKYGRGDLFRDSAFDEVLEKEERPAPEEGPKPENLAYDLETLGPTFIKLGQLLSTRPDLLPPAYITALTRLQDNVEPFTYPEVEEIVQEELGVRISKAFSYFSESPIAAASLGQVHAAALRGGREVVVKVQRPNIRKMISDDFESLEQLALFLDEKTPLGERYRFQETLEQFRQSLMRELNYLEEAQNLEQIGRNLDEFDKIVIPRPIADYTTSRVLTMEHIFGQKVTKLSPLVRLEINGVELGEELFRAYLHQIFVDGFFHADPHPGNVFLTDDNRIALLDLGMVARLTPRLQEQLLQLVLAISEGRSDAAASTALRIGEVNENSDQGQFRRRIADLITRTQNARIGEVQVGGVVMEITGTAGDCKIRVPPQLSLLGKMLLNLDSVGKTIAPEFDPNESVRRNAHELLEHRMLKSLAPGNLFAGVLELKDLVQRLPERVNRMLDALAENEFRVQVDAIDEKELIRGIQKVANRITVGLIIAAMIVAAAVIMHIETAWTLFGYPALAIILFLTAFATGAFLLVEILFKDR